MKMTRLATVLAKPISWVTHSMVMPVSASSIITSSTSLIISGSSAEVGSSNSMIFGFMHSDRAMATRCCWPPESWPGYLAACSGIFTRSRYCMAVSSASARGTLRTQIGARARFSRMVRCGNRLKCWKHMPTSRRICSICLRSLVSSTPSTMIWPRWCSSRRLIQRIKVDLPDPDGPQMTIRSPDETLRLMSLSTWNSPYHLCTSIISMAGLPLTAVPFWGCACISLIDCSIDYINVCVRYAACAPKPGYSATCRNRKSRKQRRQRRSLRSPHRSTPGR